MIDPQLTPVKKGVDEPVNPSPKKKPSNRSVSRHATKAFMKGVDVLKLRNTHNKINTQFKKLEEGVNKRLHKIVTQQKEHAHMDLNEKNYFCVVNEREIFGCLAYSIKTQPVFNLIASQMLNILIE